MTNNATPEISKSTEASTETLASSVYNALKVDILAGKLKPGHKLRLQTLKTDYKVGNSPLREALNRLSAHGMVVREENKGFRVSSASAAELEELIRTRCWLEEIALRESIKNSDDAYDERIVLAVHRLSRISINEDGSYFIARTGATASRISQGIVGGMQFPDIARLLRAIARTNTALPEPGRNG